MPIERKTQIQVVICNAESKSADEPTDKTDVIKKELENGMGKIHEHTDKVEQAVHASGEDPFNDHAESGLHSFFSGWAGFENNMDDIFGVNEDINADEDANGFLGDTAWAITHPMHSEGGHEAADEVMKMFK